MKNTLLMMLTCFSVHAQYTETYRNKQLAQAAQQLSTFLQHYGSNQMEREKSNRAIVAYLTKNITGIYQDDKKSLIKTGHTIFNHFIYFGTHKKLSNFLANLEHDHFLVANLYLDLERIKNNGIMLNEKSLLARKTQLTKDYTTLLACFKLLLENEQLSHPDSQICDTGPLRS